MLPYYAARFTAVEIDSSYYGVPQPKTVLSMNARTPSTFRFSFKAPQTVTHPPDAAIVHVHDDAKLLIESVAPLHAAGKLACVLAQFPNGFRYNERNEDYLRRVVLAFAELPVVVELRHREWQRPETLELLRELGAGYCNVDLPGFEDLPRASSEVTGAVGYVRLHGRNAATWWHGTNVTRYDYRYSADELVSWSDRVAEIEAQIETTYVFFNNHARGNAANNAEMLEALLDERYGTAADDVVAHAPGGMPEQSPLPGMN